MSDPSSPIESFDSTSLTLLAKARVNDPVAWSRLVRLYSPLIYYWCRSSRLQPADVADVLQDVFQSVARSLAQFQSNASNGSFRAWLRQITVNKLRDFHRRNALRPIADGGSENLRLLDSRSDDAIPGQFDEEVDDERESRIVLQSALSLLQQEFEPATWRAFWATVVENGTAPQAAAELGISVNAVYKAKARVLSRLRRELGPLLDLTNYCPDP